MLPMAPEGRIRFRLNNQTTIANYPFESQFSRITPTCGQINIPSSNVGGTQAHISENRHGAMRRYDDVDLCNGGGKIYIVRVD